MWRQITDAPGVRDNEIIATNLHKLMLGEAGAHSFERFVALRTEVDEARQKISKSLPKLVRNDRKSNAAWSDRQKSRKSEIDERIGQSVHDMAQAEADVAVAAKGGDGTLFKERAGLRVTRERQRLYHGTSNPNWDQFNLAASGQIGPRGGYVSGIHLTPNRSTAAGYAHSTVNDPMSIKEFIPQYTKPFIVIAPINRQPTKRYWPYSQSTRRALIS